MLGGAAPGVSAELKDPLSPLTSAGGSILCFGRDYSPDHLARHVRDCHKASSAEGPGALIARRFPESPPEARNRERKIHETRFNGVATRTSQMLSAGCKLSNQEATNALRQAGSEILSDGTDQQLTLYSRGLVSAEIKGLDHPFDRSKLRLLRYGEGDAPPRLHRPSAGRVLRGGRDRGAIPRPGGPHRSRGCDCRE
jgi:hypothetical protein